MLCPGLTSELIDELSLGWRVVRLDKREHLAEAGRIHKEAFLVAQGWCVPIIPMWRAM